MDNKKRINIIDTLYTNANYSTKYGLDIFLTIVIVIVSLVIIGYFSILNNLQSLRLNWNEEQCKPKNLPFVHIINPDPNKSSSEQITDNIKYCAKKSIKNVTNKGLQDIYNKFNIFLNIKIYIDDFILFFSEVFKWFFNMIVYIVRLLISTLQKTFIGVFHIILKLEVMFNKMLGIILVNLYIFILIFNMAMAFILNFASMATIMIIIPLGITIGILTSLVISFHIAGWALISNSFWMPWLAVLGYILLATSMAFLISLIATIVILVIMGIVMIGLLHIQASAKRFIAPSL